MVNSRRKLGTRLSISNYQYLVEVANKRGLTMNAAVNQIIMEHAEAVEMGKNGIKVKGSKTVN